MVHGSSKLIVSFILLHNRTVELDDLCAGFLYYVFLLLEFVSKPFIENLRLKNCEERTKIVLNAFVQTNISTNTVDKVGHDYNRYTYIPE